MGCHAFALLFDDIDPRLKAVDSVVFESSAHAQASLANELYTYLKDPQFLFCPTGNNEITTCIYTVNLWVCHFCINGFVVRLSPCESSYHSFILGGRPHNTGPHFATPPPHIFFTTPQRSANFFQSFRGGKRYL